MPGGCRILVRPSAKPPLSPSSAAQTQLGRDSWAGPQQNQPCLDFSIIKYITSQPASVSLEIHTESQMPVCLPNNVFQVDLFIFVCNAGGRALDCTPF